MRAGDSRIPVLATNFDVEDAVFPPMARVHYGVDFVVSTATTTAITFNLERYDTGNLHDKVTNNTRFTAQIAGVYVISGCVQWETSSTGSRHLLILLNGGTAIGRVLDDAPAAGAMIQSVDTQYALDIGDYVELAVLHNHGSDLDVDFVANYSPEFQIAWLGPSS